MDRHLIADLVAAAGSLGALLALYIIALRWF